MTRKLRRGKSKVYTHPVQTLPKAKGERGKDAEKFLGEAHQDHHLPRILVYTSAATLVTTAGTPIYPPRGGRIVGVHLNVAGAPAGADFLCDILIDGTTIFASDLPNILDGKVTSGVDSNGDLFEDPRVPGDGEAHFRAFDKVQVKVDTISGATGPLVAQLEIDWDD